MELSTIDNFDAYLKGTLEGNELREFEARLASDSEFSKSYEKFLCVAEGISQYERMQLKEQIRSNKKGVRHSAGRRRLMTFVYAAAAIVLLVLIPGYVIYRNISYSTRVFNEFYVTDPGLPVVMGNADNSMLNQAMIEYKDGNFQLALDKLDQLSKTGAGSDTISYYIGICQLELNNPTVSVKSFSDIGSESFAYYFPSQYYMALAYIKLKEYDKAVDALKNVVSCNGCYLEAKATELLLELE